jgi:hypothetical protein
MRLLFYSLLPWWISFAFCEQPPHKQVVTVQSASIDENSGIDLSYKYPNAAWTHNDSGGKPLLYLISLVTGETLATIKLENAINSDWEDIATFQKNGKSYIVVGDVGDNQRHRQEYQLCLLEEPDFVLGNPATLVVNNWLDCRFQYEDGSKNCEAIGVDLVDNQIILLEKVYHKVAETPGIYTLPLPGKNTLHGVARRISEVALKNFSALDISDDGLTLIARAYHAGYVFRRFHEQSWPEIIARKTPQVFEFPMQLQGEGVCFSTTHNTVLISTEKVRQPIFEVTLPKP